jgi:hypothetical protein
MQIEAMKKGSCLPIEDKKQDQSIISNVKNKSYCIVDGIKIVRFK